jgi:Secretion system C-terminal sorting domain
MKKIIYAALCMSIMVSAEAQISLTDSYFPAVGDVLVTANASPKTINLSKTPAKGANVTWDYSYLRQAQTGVGNDSVRYRAVDTSVSNYYSTANLMVVVNDSQRIAINKSATSFDVLGYRGVFINTLPISIGRIKFPFLPVQQERRAPLSFGTATSTNTTSWGFYLAVPSSVLPASILASLPITPDSIRVTYKTTRRDTIDGWGTLKIPGGSYSVLREKRVSYNTTLLEAKINFLGATLWQDVTSQASAIGVSPIDTTTSFYFWSNTAKEPIMVYSMRPRVDSAQTITYKYLALTSVKNTEGVVGSFETYPNPAKDAVFFDLKNWKSDSYILSINDILGKKYHTEILKVSGQQTVQVPLNGFVDGTYITTVTDKDGNVLVSKRLVVTR